MENGKRRERAGQGDTDQGVRTAFKAGRGNGTFWKLADERGRLAIELEILKGLAKPQTRPKKTPAIITIEPSPTTTARITPITCMGSLKLMPDVLVLAGAIGSAHPGQAAAFEEIDRPHDGHLINGDFFII